MCCLTNTAPAVVQYGNLLYLFVVGTDHHVYSLTFDGRSWSSLSLVGTVTTYYPPAAVVVDGIHLFVTDPTGTVQESILY